MYAMNLWSQTFLYMMDGLNYIINRANIGVPIGVGKEELAIDCRNEIYLPGAVPTVVGSMVRISMDMGVNNRYSIHYM
ncbi:MAG: hypothetical protein Q4A15_07165 [Prevotellaceae bacterium]|nr:hypothetical protein [Prevotellaceae bacterium]